MASGQYLTNLLLAVRKGKRLTQTQLARKVGLTQSHLSKIESGEVDLQVSNLIELARALDLEPVLVPRKLVPSVESLIRQASVPEGNEQRPAYLLDDDDAS